MMNSQSFLPNVQPCSRYPFPQNKSIVHNDVLTHIQNLCAAGFDINRILDIFLDSQRYKQIENKRNQNSNFNDGIKNPMQYLRATHKMSDKQRAIRYKDLEKLYNDVILTWKSIPPIDFLKQFITYINQSANNTGLDFGLVHHQITKTIHTDERIIIIDASPEYYEYCCNDPQLIDREIDFVWSDPRIYDVFGYSSNKPKRYRIMSLNRLYMSIRSTHILLFGYSQPKTLTKVFEHIYSIFKDHPQLTIHSVLPAAYIKDADTVNALSQNYSLLHVTDIDREATHVPPIYRCIMNWVLKDKCAQPKEVPFQYAKLVKTDTNRAPYIACSGPVNIDFCNILAAKLTIHKLYIRAFKNKDRIRKPTEEITISPEIKFFYSVTKLHNGKLRGKYSCYISLPAKTLPQSTHIKGLKIIKSVTGKVQTNLEGIIDYADMLLLEHEELAKGIRQAFDQHYVRLPISLKTTWFLYLPNISTLDGYDDTVCKEAFCSKDHSLSDLVIRDDITDSIITQTIGQFCQNNNWSNTKLEKLYTQVQLIWDAAALHHHTKWNPLDVLIEKRHEKQDIIYDLRDAFTLRSITLANMNKLLSILENDSDYPVLALMMLLRIYLRLSSGEVAALLIGDYEKCKNASFMQLTICKELPANGHDSVPLQKIWKNRILPVPIMLQQKLDSYLSDRIENLRLEGLTNDEIKQVPLFPGHKPTMPYRRKNVNEYVATTLKQLPIPNLKLDLPENEKLSDIAQYHSDIIEVNWDYHIIRVPNVVPLSPDDICYLAGKKPLTTVANHYADHMRSDIQLRMRYALDAMIEYHTLASSIPDTSKHQLNISAIRSQSIKFLPTIQRSQLVITPQLTQNDEIIVKVTAEQGCSIVITQKNQEVQ